ncbi:hypothetical protein JYQ62_09305 [Nostoc sp. UHCC 0702]|nr:hypothetical protein JYQ62_09305 [Nostoc sp. UHCC 0702]
MDFQSVAGGLSAPILVTCSFMLTKQEELTGLYAGYGFYVYADDRGVSRVVTPDGEEYSARLVQAGKNKGKSLTVRPIKGVPMRISLSFELPPSANSLSALAVNYTIASGIHKLRQVVFRDINISK